MSDPYPYFPENPSCVNHNFYCVYRLHVLKLGCRIIFTLQRVLRLISRSLSHEQFKFIAPVPARSLHQAANLRSKPLLKFSLALNRGHTNFN